MQHILESELEGLEEVRFPRPRRELGSTISCHLEGSRGPESSGRAVAPSGKRKDRAPRCQPRVFGKTGQRHPCPHRHTRPCHVPLRTSWRPAFSGWQACPPRLETWLVSNPSTEAPIPAPSPPALARLGHGLRRPVPRLVAASLQLLTPACAQLPPQFSLTLPRPPRLIWSRLCP